MTERTYLDWNATAPLRPQARAAMAAAMEVVGNPSSVHAEGRAARSILEEARERVAAAVGAEPRNVIFTSGGSEANALALSRSDRARRRRCDVAIASDIEHVSVLAGGDFRRSSGLAPAATASRRSATCRRALTRQPATGAKPLVALMAANNETGVIQPVREAAALAHAAGGLLHVDAVQALGKILLDIKELGADLLAVSAHKIGGPDGRRRAGPRQRQAALPRRPALAAARSATGAAAPRMSSALPASAPRWRKPCATSRARRGGCRACASGSKTACGRSGRRPSFLARRRAARANTLQFAVPGIKAQTALMALDLDGIAVSSGSACSSGTMKFSEVVRAMGYELEIAEGAVRVSMGWTTSEAEIDCFLNAWRKLSQPLLKKREIAA